MSDEEQQQVVDRDLRLEADTAELQQGFTISASAAIWAIRLYLGREPAHDEEIRLIATTPGGNASTLPGIEAIYGATQRLNQPFATDPGAPARLLDPERLRWRTVSDELVQTTGTPTSLEAAEWAIRLFLGREPHFFEELRYHRQHKDLAALRAAFIESDEFKASYSGEVVSPAAAQASPPATRLTSREMMQPIPLGEDRLLIKLPNSRMLCIDGRSIDSIDLITHGVIEPDVVGVFLRYLRPNSVVLDIGANFGYYSSLAGPMLTGGGRLYAFEANPRTFSCLQRSLQANYLLEYPHITATNVAVGETDGEVEFFFEPNFLGGASRHPRSNNTTEAVRMPMRSIDSFLPPELKVDLIKIDVEGFEPHVLAGMRQVLERSPDAKIIIELFPYMIEATYGMRRFQDLLQELGLAACHINWDSSLELLPLDEPIVGNRYALLTRTPEKDIAETGRRLGLDTFKLPPDGARLEGGTLSWMRGLTAPPALLFYGPYLFTLAGQYDVQITGTLNGPVEFLIQASLGKLVLARQVVRMLPVVISFTLDAPTDQLEIVALVQPTSQAMTIDMVLLASRG